MTNTKTTTNYNIRISGLLLLLIGCLNSGLAQSLNENVEAYAESYAQTGDFSGCILIDKSGVIKFQGCFGKANRAFSIPNKPETKFMIGSISKQFTAAAILKLQEEEKLQVSDKVAKYFENPGKAGNITIHQMLTHTSGMADIYNVANFNTLSCSKTEFNSLIELVLKEDLLFQPGSQYQYSNGNFAVLAAIIEIVSGEQYTHFLHKNLFQPLGMASTGHTENNEVIPMLATGYEPLGYTELRSTDYLDPNLLKGGGSLYSTIGDLLRWIIQLRDQTLLKTESYKALLENYGNSYGYGISVYTSKGQNVFGHDGRLNGYIADYLHYVNSDTTIILLGNIQTGVSDFFRSDIAAIVFGEEYKSSAKNDVPLQGGIENLNPYLGEFSFGPNFKVYVEDIKGRLMARANQGGYSELIPLADGRFFSRTLYAYITFLPDDNGEFNTLRWTTNDGDSFEGIKS